MLPDGIVQCTERGSTRDSRLPKSKESSAVTFGTYGLTSRDKKSTVGVGVGASTKSKMTAKGKVTRRNRKSENAARRRKSGGGSFGCSSSTSVMSPDEGRDFSSDCGLPSAMDSQVEVMVKGLCVSLILDW